MALKSGIQTYHILTNDDKVCIPSHSSILLAVHSFFHFQRMNIGNGWKGAPIKGVPSSRDNFCRSDCMFINVVFWEYGEHRFVKKCRNCTFKVNFLCQKPTEFFQKKFSSKNINLGEHFLLKTFFSRLNFWTTLLSKIMPNFCRLHTKYSNFLEAHNFFWLNSS